ncbi:hypothetical protein B0H65DRAFT_552301 [Neurospora tetraspora]|uniref:Interferon-induced 6-16 n=1 Tax=Neurospora tetraspora TaxID=94610 RepID=A0AAE0J9Q2_9PEZI|nr:hypothetical protein B0H65DRAFT_552301 [Neurospora tetraspora]
MRNMYPEPQNSPVPWYFVFFILSPASAKGESTPKVPWTSLAQVAGIAVIASPAILTAPAIAGLGTVGFGAAGPVAGTIATMAQSSIGSVVAGSPFAIAQGAAVGGYGVGVLNGIAQGAGLAVTGLSTLNSLVSDCGKDKDQEKKRKDQEKKRKDQEKKRKD